MSQKYLIIICIIFFTASTVFLFWWNARELDPNQGKSWWTLAFTDPQTSNSLSFIVENYSDESDFQYEITVDKTIVATDSFTAKRGEKMTVTPTLIPNTTIRTNIAVTLGDEKKEIYR